MIGIKEIAVFSEIINNENNLIAIYKPEINYNISENDVRNFLKDKVPSNHIPNFIFEITEIPLLQNLKYDMQYLRRYAIENLNRNDDNNIVNSKDIVLLIWNKHLPKSIENIEQTFESLGGDSLVALKIISELENYFPNLNNGLIYSKQTLSNLKNELSKERIEKLPELFIFPPRAGTYQSITNFTSQLSDKYFVRIAKYPDINEIDSIGMSILELAKLSSEYVKEHAKSEDTSFVGLSFGARISHDTACILQIEGFKINHIVWDVGPYFKNPYPQVMLDGLWSRILEYLKKGTLIKVIVNQLIGWAKQYLGKHRYKYIAIFQRRFNAKNFEKNQGKILQDASIARINSWTPMKFEGTIHLLYAASREINVSPQMTGNFGWNDYSNEVKVYKINANHVEIFESTYIEEFIKTINEIIYLENKGN